MFARGTRVVEPSSRYLFQSHPRVPLSLSIPPPARPQTAPAFSTTACNSWKGQKAAKKRREREAAEAKVRKSGHSKGLTPGLNEHTVQSANTVIVACGGAILISLAYNQFFTDSPPSTVPEPAPEALISDIDRFYAEMPIQAGHIGNLTAEQDVKLREFWAVTLKTFGVANPNAANGTIPEISLATEPTLSPTSEKDSKKKRKSLFGRKHDKDKGGDGVDSVASSPGLSAADDDKYGQAKEFHEIVEKHSAEELRSTFWTMVKADHPDALLLRFLRARKWDVEKALVMMISTMNWRFSDMHVDDDIMKNGEGKAAEDSKSSDKAVKKEGDDFLAQLRLGKSFLHGTDKEGRPLCVVRVRLHKPGEQSEASMERYTVYVIETARLVLRAPVETACIVFDMSHFGLSNMDYAPVKFMIKCFEANYPESLGAVLVHNAPFVFSAIWNIIKGWLDPVVASKIHFTKNLKDLEQYIPRSQIMKELGGDEDWEYKYVEPVPGENDLMKGAAQRIKLEEDRTKDVLGFQKKTFDWIAGGAESGSSRNDRDTIAKRLHDNYWQLDPYIRARTLYDRTGMIQSGGRVDFYPSKSAINGAPPPAATHSADDVD